MRPVRVDFIPDERWRWLWGAALACALALSGAVLWQAWPVLQSRQQSREQITQMQQRLARLQGSAVPEQASSDPRRPSLEQAARLLQQDLNKAFATIENLQIPGARLRAMNLEASGSQLRLEFEVDSVATASSVTAELNKGYDKLPWRLESVQSAAGQAVEGIAQAPRYRSIWLVQIGSL
jgi:hypothetical protein